MGDQKFIAVSIVEDNTYMRESWKAVFESVDDFVLLGTHANCEEAFRTPDILQSDVVLMDISMPGMNGIEGVRYLLERKADLAVVMCTVHDDDAHIFDAICAGAVGYLLKKTRRDELIRAIRDAANGGSPMTPGIARRVINSFQQPAKQRLEDQVNLTPRETEVLNLLAEGKSYKAIAKMLDISVHGVGYHIRSIYEKLQVHSRSEAIAMGLQKKILRPPR